MLIGRVAPAPLHESVPLVQEHRVDVRTDERLLGRLPHIEPLRAVSSYPCGFGGGHERRHVHVEFFDQDVSLERSDDLSVVIQPHIGAAIRRNRLQEDDRDDGPIGFLPGEPLGHPFEHGRFADAPWTAEQHMRGIGMFFDDQGEVCIDLL